MSGLATLLRDGRRAVALAEDAEGHLDEVRRLCKRIESTKLAQESSLLAYDAAREALRCTRDAVAAEACVADESAATTRPEKHARRIAWDAMMAARLCAFEAEEESLKASKIVEARERAAAAKRSAQLKAELLEAGS